jgi:hypothetical protein
VAPEPVEDFQVLHEIFEVQADARPDAVAVMFDREETTYADLEARANRLARHLRSRGSGARIARRHASPTVCGRLCHHNQRVVNRIDSIELAQSYYVLQIGDQDVDHITPFVLKQNQAVGQRQRFSQVRFVSQVDLIVPLSARFDFDTIAEIGDQVKAGIDPIIKVTEKKELR